MRNHYDYIIAGGGCAGLSLACRMVSSGAFIDKKILLIDKVHKNTNDRTWCFWESGEGYFENIVYRKWEKLWFHGTGFSKLLSLQPYQYKMIRGIDFYNHCFQLLSKSPYVEIIYGAITDIQHHGDHASIVVDNKKITAGLVFSSLPLTRSAPGKTDHNLLQHFKGWIIETTTHCFDPGQATLMDFRISQHHGTSFVYVMPFSTKSALIEYTLFTEALLSHEAYDQGLKDYICTHLPGISYTIKEEEFGIIPMTNQEFRRKEGKVINIGMSGGLTKPSTGYTFRFIQKDSEQIIDALKAGRPQDISGIINRKFHFYDSVLLNVLATKKYPGDKLFTTLFQKNNISDIFRFLDNESLLHQDLRLISTLPFFPFLKAGLSETVNNI